jgi:hypothetical protein
MKSTVFRASITLACLLAALAARGQSTIQVTLDFASGAPTASLYDLYIFAGTDPGITSSVATYGSYGTISDPLVSGDTMSVVNPSNVPNVYSYMFLGLYTDANAVTHVAVGVETDLTGDSWDTLFDSTNVGAPESVVISDLEGTTSGQTMGTLAGNVLSNFIGGVYPVTGFELDTPAIAQITGFSEGVHLGTATS